MPVFGSHTSLNTGVHVQSAVLFGQIAEFNLIPSVFVCSSCCNSISQTRWLKHQEFTSYRSEGQKAKTKVLVNWFSAWFAEGHLLAVCSPRGGQTSLALSLFL